MRISVTNRHWLTWACAAVFLLFGAMPMMIGTARAQSSAGPSGVDAADAEANAKLSDDEVSTETEDADAASGEDTPSIDLFDLFRKGGWLMVPIVVMSLIAVAIAIERALALRRVKVLPQEMIGALGELGGTQGGFDPRKAYRICQQFPSSAANVIRTMLLKVGRPHSEVEHAVAEASEREAARLYGNVRWLSLAAAVTPLMGLLGTVWGMIEAFFKTTHMVAGQNKADFLAGGIYVALVTTFAGLAVAIPAAIVAHYFEGRIQAMFREIEELLLSLLPQIERYEGRLRVSRQHLGDEPSSTSPPPPPPPVDAELVAKPK